MDDIFYKFDALGRRVGRDDGTASVVYFQDGQQTIADHPSGTAASSPTYTYVYASYIDEPVMRRGSGGLRYYHLNQQYSITALTDGGGSIVERYAYTAYGQVTFADASGTVQAASASSNRYTYTGREWDDGLSLYHYRARMYDAAAGRFVSRDPIGFEGSKWCQYEFLESGPVCNLDPLGLECASSSYYCMIFACRKLGWATGSCTCCHSTESAYLMKWKMDLLIQDACRTSTYYAILKGSVILYQPSSMMATLQNAMRRSRSTESKIN